MSVSILFTAKYYSIVWIYHVLLIHSSANGHVGCFHFGAVMNSAAMDIHVHVFM